MGDRLTALRLARRLTDRIERLPSSLTAEEMRERVLAIIRSESDAEGSVVR